MADTCRIQATCGARASPTRGSLPNAGTRRGARPKIRTAARARQAAPHGAQAPYERRRPEETTLYQVIQDHVETFLAQVEQETGTGLPRFVKDEFEAFLECGILGIIQNIGLLALSCESLKCSVSHGPTPAVWPQGGTLSSAGGPCLSAASWSALLRLASVRSNEARRGVTGFGAFCRNKRASPAGAKPGNTGNHVDTRVG